MILWRIAAANYALFLERCWKSGDITQFFGVFAICVIFYMR